MDLLRSFVLDLAIGRVAERLPTMLLTPRDHFRHRRVVIVSSLARKLRACPCKCFPDEEWFPNMRNKRGFPTLRDTDTTIEL